MVFLAFCSFKLLTTKNTKIHEKFFFLNAIIRLKDTLVLHTQLDSLKSFEPFVTFVVKKLFVVKNNALKRRCRILARDRFCVHKKRDAHSLE